MLNNIMQVSECANCGACLNSCPCDAIVVDTTEYFYAVKIDESKCTNCGKCLRVCPVHSGQKNLNIKGAYGGWHTDKEVRKTSSSGGAFTAIAEYVLKKNGIVYGAAYSDDCREVLVRNTEETTLDNIKRSKYVESSVYFSFRKIKKELDQNRVVLFCGTPCQVAGLHSYLNKNYDNLITADFACGGLTSHKLYESRIDELEKKYSSKVKSVNFRSGIYGWKQYGLLITFENGRKYKMPSILDPYLFAFMHARYGNRLNCSNCLFRDNHYSDFIIADFWRYNDYSNLPNDECGISLVLTNSNKAECLMREIQPNMILEKIDINKAVYNCHLKAPVSHEFLAKRDEFFQLFEQKGLLYATKMAGMKTGWRARCEKFKIIIKTRRNKKQ